MTTTLTAAAEPAQRKLWPLIALLGCVFIPMLGASVVFQQGWGLPEGRTNQGLLIQPAHKLGTELSHTVGKWSLLLYADECLEHCQQALYLSRQIHIRLGDKADRLERHLVSSASLDPELIAQHPKLVRHQHDGQAAWQQLLGKTPVQPDHLNFVLVDPRGFAMLAYSTEHSGGQVLKDIKRMLKYSYEQRS